jgi:hypothetical protein
MKLRQRIGLVLQSNHIYSQVRLAKSITTVISVPVIWHAATCLFMKQYQSIGSCEYRKVLIWRSTAALRWHECSESADCVFWMSNASLDTIASQQVKKPRSNQVKTVRWLCCHANIAQSSIRSDLVVIERMAKCWSSWAPEALYAQQGSTMRCYRDVWFELGQDYGYSIADKVSKSVLSTIMSFILTPNISKLLTYEHLIYKNLWWSWYSVIFITS